MNYRPLVSIIVLNYYGEKIIENTIDSLLKLNYPKKKYEIIVVDNNSKDNSREILARFAKEEKNIRLFFLNKNLGFSKGNNYGIKKAKGKYVALINNDCIADRNWLKELVKVAIKDKKIFAVNSKILRYPKFINIKININAKLVPVYTWLSRSRLYDFEDLNLVYLTFGKEAENTSANNHSFQVEVPYDPYNDQSVEVTLLLNSRGTRFSKETNLRDFINFENQIGLPLNNSAIKITSVTVNEDDVEYKIDLNLSTISKQSLDKIQNAGIVVFQDGYGRDIGAVVASGYQFYEYDLKQYNKEREVYAACAAAVLYSKKILDKIGYLDTSFFMYYEDVEISERARIAGYKISYQPKAVVRHYHALSSKEWSPFFIYHVEKGRLLHIFYNFPIEIFLKEYFKLIFYTLYIPIAVLFKLRIFLYNIRSRKKDEGEPKFLRRLQITRALIYFLINLPMLYLKRFRYSQKKNKEIVTQNYEKILRGEWYF